MMKSPRRIVTRSPSTAVYAPSPSTTKRSADCVWRWLGATSPGRMTCSPQYIVCVIDDFPRNAGFSSTSTRRSASFAVIRPPASIIAARISSNRQLAGRQGLRGSGVTRLASDSHSGVRFFWPIRS